MKYQIVVSQKKMAVIAAVGGAAVLCAILLPGMYMTAKEKERDSVTAVPYETQEDGCIAVDGGSTHHYTISLEEKNHLVTLGRIYEGMS